MDVPVKQGARVVSGTIKTDFWIKLIKLVILFVSSPQEVSIFIIC